MEGNFRNNMIRWVKKKTKPKKRLVVCVCWWRGKKKIFSEQYNVHVYLAGFMKTFPPNKALPSNSFFRFFFFWPKVLFSSFLPPSSFFFSFPFLRWCDFRAYRAQRTCLSFCLFHSNGCKFRKFPFQRMASCIFITTTDLPEVLEVWMTEHHSPLPFCVGCLSTRQTGTWYSVEQVWGYICDTFER